MPNEPVCRHPIERGDFFLLASRGITERYPAEELRDALLRHRADAALRLVVERTSDDFEWHPDVTMAAVTVEVL
ncbi:MAG: hypothetical protein KF837_09755 [Labilithrix sp.]|nr:hypothetical protein [Labilithrix sp.]